MSPYIHSALKAQSNNAVRLVLLILTMVCVSLELVAADKLNILFITVDDMSCDSVGAFGCKLKDTTPNMDLLALQSLRFNHAHVQVGNCMPSRNVMFSGRYPHNNRVEGFYQIRDPGYPVLSDLMKDAGYFTAIRGKVSHSTPYHPYPAWDLVLDTLPNGKAAQPKNVDSYYLSTQQAIAAAKQAIKPFYININISDPHKPFFNDGVQPDPNQPSRIFTADEVPVPGFLPDDPAIRGELAQYYSSVRRADDCLGGALKALQESGEAEQTFVMFLSDHGMPLPFAKTQLYYHSTRSPWMVRWPGVTKAGAIDDKHLISSVDLLPTLLDIIGAKHPDGLDGRSFEPLLRGKTQAGRDYVVTEYNENAGGFRHPMRAIVTREFGYIFNPWSNGNRVMATATKGTIAYRRMQVLAKSDADVAKRLDLFEHRVPEELYHYAIDPDGIRNLVQDQSSRAKYEELTKLLEAWMVKTNDPLVSIFRDRSNAGTREAFMQQQEDETAARKAPKAKQNKKKGKNKKKAGANVQ